MEEVEITMFKTVYNVWIQIWEQIPKIIKIWNTGLINLFIDVFESSDFWKWLAEKAGIGDITVPFDISLGDLFIHFGLTFLIALFVVITVLKLLDLIIFFS